MDLINEKAIRYRELYENFKLFGKKELPSYLTTTPDNASVLYSLTFAHEKLANDLHGICPHLDEVEIDTLAVATLALNTIEDKNLKSEDRRELLKAYLTECTEYDDDTITLLTGNKQKALNWLRGFIIFLSDKNKKRAKSLR